MDSLKHVASHSSLGVLIQVLLENSVVGVERIPDVVVIFNSGIESLVLNLLKSLDGLLKLMVSWLLHEQDGNLLGKVLLDLEIF